MKDESCGLSHLKTVKLKKNRNKSTVHHHYNGVNKITPTKDWKKGKIQPSSAKEDNWIIREKTMLKARGKKWLKLLSVCWIFILLLSSGQVLAQEPKESVKQVIIVKNEKGEPIDNAVFEIRNDKNDVLETCVSDASGCAQIKKANEGKYQLKQIKTQMGYELAKEYRIEIKIENPIKEEVVINQIKADEVELVKKTGQDTSNENKEVIKESTENENSNSKPIENVTELEEEKLVDKKTEILTALVVDDININVTQASGNTTQFTISTVGYAGKTGISKVLFPTWSERNGQDDLTWYSGIRGSNGEYSVTLDNKDHGFETGIYNIHTYIYGLSGETLKTLVNTYELSTPKPIINVGGAVSNCFKISVSGVSNNAGVAEVLIPTWSQTNGQDDLQWQAGTYVGNDTWEVTINLNDYKQTFDTFISHVYVKDGNGEMVFLKSVEKTIDNPFNEVTLSITQDSINPNQFVITTVGYAGKSGIGKVCFPTWSERNGQDDIQWYEGTLNSKGEYSFIVDSKEHGFETGIYNVHTYIYGLRGDVIKIYTDTQSLETQKTAISVTEVTNNTYKVRLTGVSNPQGISKVSFPTWSQVGGQDDLQWESGVYVGNDTWEATVHIIDYKSSYDTFITHAYVTNKEVQQKYLGATEKMITNPFLEESLEINAEQDNDVSKFTINTKNCSGKAGIKSAAFAVWTNRNGQDEIKWYEGTLGTNGEFKASVDIEEFGYETGPFVIHTYLRGNGGENIAVSGSSFTMPKINPTIEYDNAILNNIFKIRIKNVGDENGVASIIFPTWSNTNGQDDMRWEQATYIGNNTWEATINLRNYNIIVDDFITHAYLIDRNGKKVFAKESVKHILQNTTTIYGFFAYPLDKNYKANPSDPTDWFGPRWGDIHEGIDIPADRYASCYSVANGVVEKAGYFMGYGRYIRIRTTDRYGESVSFFYGHLQEINVSVGQSVSIGQKIGSVGGSGYNAQGKYIDDAYGTHLHFGAIVNSDYACVDPEIWIDFHNLYNNV